MDRICFKRAWLLLLACMVVGTTGCSIFATALYVIQGTNTRADYDKLKGKRVAVVCRPVSSLQYRNFSAAKELAKQVSVLLQENVKKIHMIDQREIAEWTDENNWEEYTEIGKALNADVVIGLELEGFSLYDGPTLYHGKSTVKVAVYDMKEGSEPVWEKAPPQIQFPPNSPISTADKPEAQFRRQFVKVVAQRIAYYFYDHDSTVDFASDSTALND